MLLLTNNAKDFEPLHGRLDHAGILLYHEHSLPYADPEGLAMAVDEVVRQYGRDGLVNEIADLGEWYAWLHE